MNNNCKFGIVFPGQGSQTIGMLRDFPAVFPIVQQTFAEASAILAFDLWQLAQNGPAEKINQTEITQPLLLTASVAVWRCWQQMIQATPAFMAGHSLGEYTALVCSGAISFEDGVKLVQERGRLMQTACQNGGMAAIVGLTAAKVLSLCQQAAQGAVLIPANYNTPEQIVISGELEAVKRAVNLAEAAGAKLVRLLPISIPAHSPLMKTAAEQLERLLNAIPMQLPSCPIVHNFNVSCQSELASIRQAVIQGLYSPVRWVEVVEYMVKAGVTALYECGPGRVLTGLNRAINSQLTVDYLGEAKKLQTFQI